LADFVRTNGWLFGCAKTHLGEGGFYYPAGSFVARLEKAGRTKKLYYSPFAGATPAPLKTYKI